MRSYKYPKCLHENRKASVTLIACVMLSPIFANGQTLVSTALRGADVDISGNSIFSGSPSASAPEIADVTTTVVSNPGQLGGKLASGTTGPKTLTLRAVSPSNGMDLTYDVVFSPFRYRGDTNVDQATSTATLGSSGASAAVSSANSNTERNQTTFESSGGNDFREFFRVDIGNVMNSGSTDYNLDGAITVSFLSLSGFGVYESYALDSFGTQLALGGNGSAASGVTDLSLSAPATSFAIVATGDDTSSNNDNRWNGLAVQFTAVPEPSGFVLVGLGGLLFLTHRRR